MKTVIKLFVCFTLAFSFAASAEDFSTIITDGTTGSITAHTTLQPTIVDGKNYFEIPQSLGTPVGGNLFHSFRTFNINNGETATFTGSNTIQNVISRVTGIGAANGLQPSIINGALKSEVGNANFYFINPAGVIFGANATINVPAAFHVSTANSLNFKGFEFSATNPTTVDSTLTIATPESFGFLGPSNGEIVVNGSQLTVNTGQTLDLVSGNISLNYTSGKENRLEATSGEIRLVAIQGKDLVDAAKNAEGILALPTVKLSASNAGKMTVSGNAGSKGSSSNDTFTISTKGDTGGRIALWGGEALFTTSTILANNNGVANATPQQGVNVHVNSLTLNNTSISADVESVGNSGNVTINATESIDIKNGGFIGTSLIKKSTGNAGDTQVRAKTLSIDKGDISTAQTGIFSRNEGSGNSGHVIINANNLSITNGGTISSTTLKEGAGGDIQVTTTDTLEIDNKDNKSTQATGIFSETRRGTPGLAGAAGKIIIDAHLGTVDIVNRGMISTTSFSDGNAGRIEVTAKTLKIDGQGHNNTVQQDFLKQPIPPTTAISSEAKKGFDGTTGETKNGIGNAGEIIINAGIVEMSNNGKISTSTFTQGKAGDVTVNAATLSLDNATISALADTGSTGKAGNVTINKDMTGTINLANNSQITVQNKGTATDPLTGVSGNLNVQAADLKLDKSSLTAATSGNVDAGSVNVDANNLIAINQAEITSSTSAQGKAGDVTVNTPQLSLENAKISALADTKSTGKAGNVTINKDMTGTINLANNSQITVQNKGTATDPLTGVSGNLNVQAADLKLDNSSLTAATIGNVNAGFVTVNANNLTATHFASISSSTNGQGKAGDVTVNSQHLSLNNAEISALADTKSTGNAGNLIINDNTVGIIDLSNNSRITVQNNGTAPDSLTALSGNLKVSATDLTMDKSSLTAATSGNVDAGSVSVKANNLIAINQAEISASTSAAGNAGNVTVTAPIISIDNASIKVTAEVGSTGNAGSVTVKENNKLTVTNSASINSSTYGIGYAGDVIINSGEVNVLNGSDISSDTWNANHAGAVDVTANSLKIDGEKTVISSDANEGSRGDAHKVTVNAKNIEVRNGGQISSTAKSNSSGNAGEVVVVSSGILQVSNGGQIATDTYAGGKAGVVDVKANKLSIDGENFSGITGISSDADEGSRGDAHEVIVNAETLEINNNGQISSNANGSGDAGSVTVHANNALIEKNNASISSSTSGAGVAGIVDVSAPLIIIDNAEISAAAKKGSSGETGNVIVTASKTLSLGNQSKITIQNEATVANPNVIKAGEITISAPDINLKDSSITAESSQNVDAGNINIHFSHALNMDPSYISTAANSGNGGAITITGGDLIYLQNSGFKTSVADAKGNGGNINVTAHTLVMDNGVIQANAKGGRGGDINLNINTLIPTQNNLIIGGLKVDWLPFQSGLNIIQAASQNGVSGNINVTSPKFNISGSLTGLGSLFVVPTLENNPCLSSTAYTSSLARHGKGGVATNEMRTVFVPALVKNAHFVEQKSTFSNALTFQEKGSCISL